MQLERAGRQAEPAEAAALASWQGVACLEQVAAWWPPGLECHRQAAGGGEGGGARCQARHPQQLVNGISSREACLQQVTPWRAAWPEDEGSVQSAQAQRHGRQGGRQPVQGRLLCCWRCCWLLQPTCTAGFLYALTSAASAAKLVQLRLLESQPAGAPAPPALPAARACLHPAARSCSWGAPQLIRLLHSSCSSGCLRAKLQGRLLRMRCWQPREPALCSFLERADSSVKTPATAAVLSCSGARLHVCLPARRRSQWPASLNAAQSARGSGEGLGGPLPEVQAATALCSWSAAAFL